MKTIVAAILVFLFLAGIGNAVEQKVAIGNSEGTSLNVLESFSSGHPKHGIVSIGDKRKEVWWNSYGQPLEIDGNPTLVLRFYNDTNSNELYVYKENGEIVAFRNRLISINSTEWTGWQIYAIPSNKLPHELPPFKQAGMNAKEYQRKFGVNRNYLQNSNNYQTIYDNLYSLTPDYQAKENIQLRHELELLNQTVGQHSTWLEIIRRFINQTFGTALW